MLLLQAIQHRRLQYPRHLSSLAVSFLSAAFTRNPQQRPTAAQLLQHPFIASHMAV
jgi:serine/threonine protein kinase